MKLLSVIRFSGIRMIIFYCSFAPLYGSIPEIPKPVITPVSDWCYDDNLTLTHNITGYSSYSHNWQYGIYVNVWYPKSGFSGFIEEVINSLKGCYSNDPSSCDGCNMDKISQAARSTDYHFMNDYYELYSNLNGNKETIAHYILDGIGVQNQDLSQEERRYVTTSYSMVAASITVWVPPYEPIPEVVEWTNFNPAGNESISFVPVNLSIPASEKKIRIGVRVNISSGTESGPYSEPEDINIKPRPPSFAINSSPSCPDYSSGQISLSGITSFSGIGDYEIIVKKENEPAGPSDFFSGSSFTIPKFYESGNYYISLYYNNNDIGGCTEDLRKVTIQQHPDMSFEVETIKNASCPGSANGEISATIGPHYLDYQFSIGTNLLAVNTNGKFTGLQAGTYTINATDACHSSSISKKSIITEPAGVKITLIKKTDPNCNSIPNGSIEVEASGGITGNSTFSYQLIKDGSLIQSGTGYPKWTGSGLSGGNYTVSVSAGGCAPATSPVQTLSYVQPVNFTATAISVDCFGMNTGSIEVSASGGINSYIYYVDGVQKSPPFGSLYSGTYLVTVKSTACNDVKTGYVTVGTSPKIEITFPEVIKPSCFEADNGKITASVTGGTGGYNYSWESDVKIIPDKSATINGLIAGNYTLHLTDSKNCTVSKSTNLSDPPELIVQSAIPSDAACFGDNGAITVTTTGGSGGNVYSCNESSGLLFTNSAPSVSVPAGEYYVQAKDKYGCLAEYYDVVTVTDPDSPLEFSWQSPEFNGFNISCAGETTGQISVEAAGGNGLANDGSEYEGYLFSLSGSAYQTANSFSGIAAGSHVLGVKDGRGCIVQKSVTLTEPGQLSINLVSSSPVKCFGAATGEIIVTAAGGIENTWKYRLDGAEILTPGIFSDLYAGTYEIEVSDLNGCRKSIFPSVESQYSPISILAATKNVRCFGEGNGEITATVTGGAGGYSYEWEKMSGADWTALDGDQPGRTNVPPGFYRVKVTDSENCYEYGNADISEPGLLRVTGVNVNDIICMGEKGSISIDASGGTADYTYFCSAETGDIFESTNPVLQLPAGKYTARITDVNGCVALHPAALQITQPASPLDFTPTLSSYHGYSVSCYGKNDGLVTIDAFGGNGATYSGYTYSIESNPFGPDNSFSDLGAGTYTLKVSDARGCITKKNVVLSQPGQVRINLQGVSKVKCYGASTGEIQVGTSGGVPEYAFRLNGTPVNSSGTFIDLKAQTYSVEVTDLNGCTSGLTTIVEHKNPPISSTLTPAAVRCYAESNGAIITELTGGSGGFTSSWEKKSGTVWQQYESGTDLANLAAGNYRLKVVDSDNCPDTDSVEVKQPEPLKITNVKIKDAVCFGDPGSFGIEATGGNGNYLFQYSPDNSKVTYLDYVTSDPLQAGIYGLKVTDSRGCVYEDPGTYRITSPSVALNFSQVLSAYGNYNVSCHGNNDGSVSVHASGGNEFGYTGYTYRLSGRQGQEESIFTRMEAGSYDIIVTDGRGCSITKPVTLTEPESAITLRASSLKRPLCVYDSNGAVTLTASGGSLPYQYSMNDNGYTASTEFSGLPVNSYRFRVRDSNGCSEIFDTSLVNIISEMSISGDISDVKCFGENTGSINVNVTGGALPFSYTWKENPSSASSVTGLLKGSYTVFVTDSAGCRSEKMFSVKEPEKPLSITAVSSPACVALKNGTIDATAMGGTAPYRFAVDSDKDFPLPSSFNVYSGNHMVYVSDRNGCLAQAGVYVDVRNTMPDINFMLATSRYELDTLVVIDVSVPAPDKVTWEFSESATVIGTGHNMAKVRYNSAGLYPVKMTGLFGTCAYTIEKILNIAPFDPAVIGDGKNREGIKSLKITPNPNDGAFELGMELYTKQQVTVKIFDLSSRLLYDETYPADLSFVREISLPETVMPGTYVLRATCENDARTTVFVISK